MRIEIPELSVVALMGVSGSGKSTFAKAHFMPAEVLSLDSFRGLASGGGNDRGVGGEALETLYALADKRLDLGLLTVLDAPHADKEDRAPVLRLAKAQDCVAVALVLDMPQEVCQAQGRQRPDRGVDDAAVGLQIQRLRRCIKDLKKEGFRHVHVLRGQEEAARAEILRVPLRSNKKDVTGPFDIIGDVHGCYEELCALLAKLGYRVEAAACTAMPPQGRRALFLGDLCDRGPKNVQVLRLVMGMVRAGTALCIAGNHDAKLARYLKSSEGGAFAPTSGRAAEGGGSRSLDWAESQARPTKIKLNHGLDITVQQLAQQPPAFLQEVKAFTNGLDSHYVLDAGKLVVAHAGLKEKYQGRSSARVRSFCLYGDTTGEVDEYGLPVRLPWANEYRGKALVVYGHTPLQSVQRVHNAVCIDTGCVFGGKLTAYRYPEGETLQVEALRIYYQPVKPLAQEAPQATQARETGDAPAMGGLAAGGEGGAPQAWLPGQRPFDS